MVRANLQRVLIVVGFVSLGLIYAVLWVNMISDPAERFGSDFISAYTGGRVADLFGARNVYNLDYQHAIQEVVVGFPLESGQVLMFNHVPYLVPFLSLLMDENYIGSLLRYTLIMVGLYMAAMTVAWRLLKSNGWTHQSIYLVLGGMGTFFPLFVSLINTQDTAILVLGGFLWLLGFTERRDWLAGLGLAFTSVRPQITLVVAIPFLFFSERRKIWWFFLAWMSVLGLISMVAVGREGCNSFLRIILISSGGDFYGLKEPVMVNFIGLMWRIFPHAGNEVVHAIGWSVYCAVIIGLSALIHLTQKESLKYIAMASAVAMFVSPHLHYHDIAFLLIPLIISLITMVEEGDLKVSAARMIPLILSWCLLLSTLIAILHYNLPVFLYLLTIIFMLSPTILIKKQGIIAKP
jgi:hypothetical protein